MVKNTRLVMRLTEEEKRILFSAAARLGYSTLADFIRDVLLDVAMGAIDTTPEEFTLTANSTARGLVQRLRVYGQTEDEDSK